jgi:acetyl esterase/lipase
MMGGRQDLHPAQRDRYLAAGFAVVAIDYRLAPETKLSGIIDDLQDAYDWLCRKGPADFNIDPQRVAVVGHSTGGYLALLAGYHLQPRPAALVSFYGYGDITAEWYSRPDPFYNQQPAIAREDAYRAVGETVIAENPPRGRGRLYRYFRQQGIWPREVTGHNPDLEPHVFESWCPIRNVTSDYPATLLLHGDRDTDVPLEQSVSMAEELARHGVPYQLIRHAEWGHGFDGMRAGMRDPEIARAFDRVIAFLDRHLESP